MEQLEDRRLLAWDFGDAPSPYPTLADENGAKHADDWMQLGASIVGESASEKSGRSVSMSSDGTRIAVGSYENDGAFSDSGHVRIYERIDGDWTQLGSDIDGQTVNERFGFSVSLSGDGGTVVVGSSHNNGMVRVYRFVEGNWEQVGLDLIGESNQDSNGYAVSINDDGSIIAIGAPNNHGGGDFSGQARVFQLLDSSWQQLGSDIHGLANSFSGISLALAASGSRLVVGAPFGGGGLVRTYDFNGSDWVQLGSDIVGESDGDVFGRSVSMNAEGNVIAVGADYNEGNGTQAGHVRVFELVEGAWIQIGADLDGKQSYHQFGFSVDLDSSGETLAVGAPHTSTAGEDNPGSMTLYKRFGDSWVQVGERLTGNLNGEAFGWSVSLDASGTNVVAGVPRAPNPSSGGTEWGTANVYAIGTASLRLGLKKSLELDGNVSQNADGDGDSDDGVIFGELKVGQANASVLVNVQNANVNAKLDAWIDFNGDGNWSGSQEQISRSLIVSEGINLIQFAVPASASPGDTYARFRLSSSGALGSNGTAASGEVEDYLIHIAPPAAGSLVFGSPSYLDLGMTGAEVLLVADLNSDGWDDVIMEQENRKELSWYQNLRNGSFRKQVVSDSEITLVSSDFADFDGDGDLDIVNVVDLGYLTWLELDLDAHQVSFKHQIAHSLSSPVDVKAVDLDANGTADLVVTSQGHVGIVGFINDGFGNFERLPLHSFDNGIITTETEVADLDRDGDLDFLTATESHGVFAFINNGLNNFTKTLVTSDSHSGISVGDFDGDGFLDFAGTYRETGEKRTVIYQNTFSNSGISFTARQEFIFGCDDLSVADINGDGLLDVTVSAIGIAPNGLPPEFQRLTVLINSGGFRFTPVIIANSLDFPNHTAASDFDNDGDLDLLLIEHSPGDLSIYQQNARPTLDPISDFVISENATEKIIELFGISAGGTESQPLRVTASSNNTGVILDPIVTYTTAEASGTLKFTPLASQSGITTITVTVEDGGLDLDLATVADNAIFTRTFDVTVNAVNDAPTLNALSNVTIDEDATGQTVNLTGISAGGGESQLLRVTASSSNTVLIANPTVTYTSADSTGMLKFMPVSDQSGVSTITVTVEDGGLDGILETAADNATFTRTFVVTVNAVNDPPILDSVTSPKLHSIDRISGPPIGAVGTPVASLIDTGGPLNNFSDVDGDLPGIAITALNLQEGALWFSENSGTNWMKVGEVSEQNPLLLPAVAGRRLYFEPEPQFGGTINNLITFRAWDGSGYPLGIVIEGEAAGDRLGYSTSLSAGGNTVAIGAPGYPGNSGQVRIYDWNGNSWEQRGTAIYGEAVDDETGIAISLSSDGNAVAIAANGSEVGDGDFIGHSGNVRIYDWNGNSWEQRGADIDGEAEGDAGLRSISLSSDGNTVAIGAPLNDGNGNESGHVRIYDWNGNSWEQRGADIDGEAAGDWSGISVSMSSDGNTVAIGAPLNDGNGNESGHVRVYNWNGNSWEQRDADIDGEAAGDWSGISVSMSADGNTVAIGAPANDGKGDGAGHVRIHDWNGSTWEQRGTDIDGEAAGDLSGISVSLSSTGNTVAIGAHGNGGKGVGAGHVRIHDWNGSTWEQRGADIDGEAAGDGSGYSVSLSSDGHTVAVGAYRGDGNGTDSGYVRIYRINDQPSLSFETDTVSVLVNATPTLDALPNMAFNEEAEEQLVNLEGISAGGGESQPLRVTATSSDETVASVSAVVYESAKSSGLLRLALTPNAAGVSVITVSVEDGGLDNDLTTIHDNATVGTSFEVAVGLSSFTHSGDRLVSFVRPASQTLTVSSSESALALQLAEGVWYGDETLSASGTGENTLVVLDRTLSRFELTGKFGQVIKFDRPLDWRMAAWDPTSEPNFRPIASSDDPTRLFYLDWGQPWQNILDPSDVNNNGSITSLDALQIINELSIQQYTDPETGMLLDPESLPIWPGTYYDQNGDGKATSLDALRVINSLTRIIRGGEGEAVTADYLTGRSDAIWSKDLEFNEDPCESEFVETDFIYSDSDPETTNASERPEDLVYTMAGKESTEAVDSLLSDLEDWGRLTG